ncbi:hypothetical protein SAMN05444401_3924 [Clostridium amylolyticum]|uniref:Sulfotransferase family protein n=1 Tax=Clostridium amylolyticum TaxID=1121298 RepID=A0A1M6MAY8_9CLOT|nr:sulfotransferase [Clostridium amylolyticum]SHJ80626.1 hypothetical protein SAMN05444401_3924 [Clostridium amylolyticum]
MGGNKHKIITCAGYGATGSSVVTDLLKEFDNCYSTGDYEFRFIQDYEGISYLESALLENRHRLNSDIAIRRFKKIIDYHSGNFIFPRYERFFNGKFKEISYRYIDKLVDVSWKGYWEHHAIDKNAIVRFFCYKIYPRIKKIIINPSERRAVIQPPKSRIYFSYPEDRFYNATKEYMQELFHVIDLNFKYEYLVFDQLVPPANINRYLNYFYDLKVVVIDRDPRDIFAINEMYEKESWIPSHDLDVYIKWFRKLRQQAEGEIEDPKNIMRVKFEDTVIKYDDFLKEIYDFIGITDKNHIHKRQYFNPDISIKNIGVYKIYPDQEKVRIIEQELKEYCYDEV